jgi:hypothetical protein
MTSTAKHGDAWIVLAVTEFGALRNEVLKVSGGMLPAKGAIPATGSLR